MADSKAAPEIGAPGLSRSESTTLKGRLIVVTNRLPVKFGTTPGGRLDRTLRVSDGGLVSALNNLGDDYDMVWIGWVGMPVDNKEDLAWMNSELKVRRCVPVFLRPEVADDYYNGFCNNVLWPLLHYVPVPIEGIEKASKEWAGYAEANALFAKAVLSVYRPGDFVWVHDYHLMLLPTILRQARPGMRIGFFSHVPFPSSEVYRVLPCRRELLGGVLQSDLIGFQTHDYVRHFRNTAVRSLGAAATARGLRRMGHVAQLGAFPIGINPDRFLKCLETPACKALIRRFREMYRGQKVILGVDRLDYIKGIPLKIKAFDRFFADNPKWIGKAVLIQIAVPSRGKVSEYKKLKRATHELVGRVNGKYSELGSGSVPIHYLDKAIPFVQLCALYHIADSLIVTSVRDGMNLVSFEYVVCQRERHGVLILSEFAGAAQSLGAGCVRINPWDIPQTARAIKYALELGEDDRKRFHDYAFEHVRRCNTRQWARGFIRKLKAIEKRETRERERAEADASLVPAAVPPQLDRQEVIDAFFRAGRRLLIYGVHGTLANAVQLEGLPRQRFGYIKCTEKVKQDIDRVASDPYTTLVLLSSSPRETLERAYGSTSAWLAAENGYFLSVPDPRRRKRRWKVIQDRVDLSWRKKVYEVFQHYTERVPSSFICNHETSIEWHYHDADAEYAKPQAHDLVSHLRSGPLLNTNTEIIDADSIVRIQPLGVSKGVGAVKVIERVQRAHRQQFVKNVKRMQRRLLLQSKHGLSQLAKTPPPSRSIDFIMCVGKLTRKDEDIFRMLNSMSNSAELAGGGRSRTLSTTSGGSGRPRSPRVGAGPFPTTAAAAAAPTNPQRMPRVSRPLSAPPGSEGLVEWDSPADRERAEKASASVDPSNVRAHLGGASPSSVDGSPSVGGTAAAGGTTTLYSSTASIESALPSDAKRVRAGRIGPRASVLLQKSPKLVVFTATVGRRQSHARYHLPSVEDSVGLLGVLGNHLDKRRKAKVRLGLQRAQPE